jgi:hypothetical protein
MSNEQSQSCFYVHNNKRHTTWVARHAELSGSACLWTQSSDENTRKAFALFITQQKKLFRIILFLQKFKGIFHLCIRRTVNDNKVEFISERYGNEIDYRCAVDFNLQSICGVNSWRMSEVLGKGNFFQDFFKFWCSNQFFVNKKEEILDSFIFFNNLTSIQPVF